MQPVQKTSAVEAPTEFLVCGLGRLGQHCVVALKEFGVTVRGITLTDQLYWNVAELPNLLEQLVIGDCRYPKTLLAGGIERCRGVLLVTSDEQTNIEAAFAVRSLNPGVRLVIRSTQENLNALLAKQLGNFVAFEATQLPTTAFALAALGGESCGFFKLDSHLFRVVQTQIDATHPWCDRRRISELNTATRRVLSHLPKEAPMPSGFYQWEPEATVCTGDLITYVELSDGLALSARPSSSPSAAAPFWSVIRSYRAQLPNPRDLWQRFWQKNQTQRVIVLCTSFMLALFLIGTLLYKLSYPDLGWTDALNVGIVLALGGFGELFGDLKLPFPIPWWLHFYSLGLTLAGTIFIGILYAILTEQVLAARFQFLRQRPSIPRQNHVILVGLGQVGQRVAQLLLDLRQALVGVNAQGLDAKDLPQMPLVVGNWKSAFEQVNLESAQSLIAVTDNEVVNLEIALTAYAANPALNLVICTYDTFFTEHVEKLLPYTKVLGIYALAAEVYASAAFGENILELLHLNHQTILVTEYQVEAEDTLNGLLLAEAAYGYGVVPIVHQRDLHESIRMPSSERSLQKGDRLIVFATLEGLRRIEQGALLPRLWQVRVERAISTEAAFEGAMVIVQVSGCDIGAAIALMNHLPDTLPYPLYKHQAQRLVQQLGRLQVSAQLIQVPNA